jgi:HPt (histidine-containing phosphotransfer) domain-containing protein
VERGANSSPKTGLLQRGARSKPIGTELAQLTSMQWQTGGIDPSGLLAVCRAGSAIDHVLLYEILGHFVRQNGDRMTQVTAAVETADRVKVAQIAHAIKGSAAMVGAGYLSQLAKQIELDAAAGSPALLVNDVTAMQGEFAAVVRTLRAQYPAAFEAEPSV